MRSLLTGKSGIFPLTIVAAVAVLFAGYALAQTPPASTAVPATTALAAPPASTAAVVVPARRATVKGVLTGNGVNIRTGAGREYPVFFSAPLNFEVEVLGQQGEWYEVEFPIKGFSWITKEYFQRIDEKTGIVTGNNVSVRGGPGQQYDRLYVVPNGYKFQVLGSDPKGEWFKVAPSADQTAWVLVPYVRLSAPLPSGAPVTTVPGLSTGTDLVTTTVGPITTISTTTIVPLPTEKPVTVVEPTPEPVKPDPAAERFVETEKKLDSELKKENPVDWDLAALEAAYTDVAANSTNSITRGVARQRLVLLKYYKKEQDRYKEIGKIDEELSARLKQLERQRAEQITAIPEIVEAPFIATGNVDKFYLKGIGGATHKLVEGGSILYLLKSSVVDFAACEGKRCGIRGKITTVPNVNIRLIEVEFIKPLDQPVTEPTK